MKISVFILTCERPKDLKRCLLSLKKQTKKPDEILIVNNGKDEETKKILKKFKLKSIFDQTKKLSYLFNLGWRNCQNGIISFLADDAEPDTRWLEMIEKAFLKYKDAGVVCGPIISTCYPAGEMHRLYLKTQKNWFLKFLTRPIFYFVYENKILSPGHLCQSGAYSLGASLKESKNYKEQEIDLATTSSMGIKREVLEKINGFDEIFYFNHADGDLFVRIKKNGYKIIFDPKIIAKHHLKPGPSRFPFFIGRDTGSFLAKNIRPKSFRGFIGFLLNILVFNFYFLSKGQFKGNFGFFKGVWDYF